MYKLVITDGNDSNIKFADNNTGKFLNFDISKCDLIAYANGGYYSLGKKIGKFGFSVKKK